MALNELQIDKALKAQGTASEELNELKTRRQWYRPDGTSIFPADKLGPGDRYHFILYTAKGWTLAPQLSVKQSKKDFEPAHPELPEMTLVIPPIVKIQDFFKVPEVGVTE